MLPASPASSGSSSSSYYVREVTAFSTNGGGSSNALFAKMIAKAQAEGDKDIELLRYREKGRGQAKEPKVIPFLAFNHQKGMTRPHPRPVFG